MEKCSSLQNPGDMSGGCNRSNGGTDGGKQQPLVEDSGNESSVEQEWEEEEIEDEEEEEDNCEELKEEGLTYEVLTTDEIIQHMDRCIQKVQGVLVQFTGTVIRILLNHFGWDDQKLLEFFFDGTDLAKLSKQVGIVLNANPDPGNVLLDKTESCQICFEEYRCFEMIGMGCRHMYCQPCWLEYLKHQIMDAGSEAILCITPDCRVVVEDDVVLALLSENPSVQLKYHRLMSNRFVQCNSLTKWCPSPGCSNVVQLSTYGRDWQPVTCTCSWTFCFRCSNDWHAPAGCELLKKWVSGADSEKKTNEWITVNTKDCPKCKTAIEKNGGCNHMDCFRCRHSFCWSCLGQWSSHNDYYACNRYASEEAMAKQLVKEKLLEDKKRYEFYSSRFANHKLSLELERKLWDNLNAKIKDAIKAHSLSPNQLQYLKEAVDVLCCCRQTLMYTYPFAFYAKRNNQTEIFEDNQRDLEKATEKLSEYLERKLTQDNLEEIKSTVIDTYRYCDIRRKVLVDHVREGTENDWWDND